MKSSFASAVGLTFDGVRNRIIHLPNFFCCIFFCPILKSPFNYLNSICDNLSLKDPWMAVILEGQIRNGDCKPIEDVEVEVWYAGLNDLTGWQLKNNLN